MKYPEPSSLLYFRPSGSEKCGGGDLDPGAVLVSFGCGFGAGLGAVLVQCWVQFWCSLGAVLVQLWCSFWCSFGAVLGAVVVQFWVRLWCSFGCGFGAIYGAFFCTTKMHQNPKTAPNQKNVVQKTAPNTKKVVQFFAPSILVQKRKNCTKTKKCTKTQKLHQTPKIAPNTKNCTKWRGAKKSQKPASGCLDQNSFARLHIIGELCFRMLPKRLDNSTTSKKGKGFKEPSDPAAGLV